MEQCQRNSSHLFQRHAPFVAGNRRLREPQIQGYEALRSHFAAEREPALVQIPVGCGKTGLMALLPFGIANGRALLVAPNVTIRETIFQAVDTASDTCFWRRAGVAPVGVEGPFAARIDSTAQLTDCIESHFVVTNVQQIGTSRNRWLGRFPHDFFDMILIDEGHHNPAASWRRLIDHFTDAKVVSLTATPFRSDGAALIGKPVYRYSFLRAMCRGYIKRLRAVHVQPRELAFTFCDEPQEVSLTDVMRLREEVWFSRGVALAPECNRHIVRTSIAECEKLRQARLIKHQIIAAACSVHHAGEIARLYREAGYIAEEIHSGQPKSQRQNVLARLKDGRLDVIVQVEMLGEGFDHPPLSVAAVFRPFRSLSPYVQFVGRIMRTVRQSSPNDPDNCGVVVSHVGLNTERHWSEFRSLDKQDQDLWAGLAGGGDVTPSASSSQAGLPREFSPDMLVSSEILGEFRESLFGHVSGSEAQQPLPLSDNASSIAGPQQRRQEARTLLQERVNDSVRETLWTTRLSGTGWQIGRRFAFVRRQNNWAATRQWTYIELNKRIGRRPAPGKEWSLNEIEQALDVLPDVRQEIVKKLQSCFRRKETWPRSARF